VYTCPVCNEGDEDELHFVLQCPVYEDLRKIHLPVVSCTRDQSIFLNLFKNGDSTCPNIALYLYHALKRRSAALSIAEF